METYDLLLYYQINSFSYWEPQTTQLLYWRSLHFSVDIDMYPNIYQYLQHWCSMAPNGALLIIKGNLSKTGQHLYSLDGLLKHSYHFRLNVGQKYSTRGGSVLSVVYLLNSSNGPSIRRDFLYVFL